MKQLKVCHVITRLDKGGSSFNTIDTVGLSNPERFMSDLIAGRTNDPDGSMARHLERRGVTVEYIDSLRRDINPINDAIAFYKLLTIFIKREYDIVHTHTSKAGIIARWAAWFAGVECIVHTPHGHIFHGYFSKLVTRIFIMLEQLSGLITDYIITLTKLGKEDHIRFSIAAPDKFVPIYSGIDVKKFHEPSVNLDVLRANLGINEDDLVVGSVSRLDPIKGNEFIIRAAAKIIKEVDQVKFLLVGDGEERLKLEKLADELGVAKKIIFTGFREDVVDLIHIMDVFVLASLNEGMGRAVLEAFACSKPVIGSRTGGIPELISENYDGYLVDCRDDKAIAEYVVQLLQDSNKRAQFGERAKEKVNAVFSMEKMVYDIQDLYERVVSDKL